MMNGEGGGVLSSTPLIVCESGQMPQFTPDWKSNGSPGNMNGYNKLPACILQ